MSVGLEIVPVTIGFDPFALHGLAGAVKPSPTLAIFHPLACNSVSVRSDVVFISVVCDPL